MTEEFEDQPNDPFEAAAESIQFEAPDQAALKLRRAIGQAMQEGESDRRLQSTVARSMEELAAFRVRNPNLNDDMVEAAIERRVIKEQLADLEAAGADLKAWSQTLGHDPTPFEIANAHLQYRANGLKGVRTASALLEAATDTVTSRFGIPRTASGDASAKILAQKNAARAKRNLAPLEAGTVSTDSDSPTSSDITAESFTRQMFGGEGSLPIRDDHRANAVQTMVDQRLGLRGRKPNIYR
jgi:hypothetical protein